MSPRALGLLVLSLVPLFLVSIFLLRHPMGREPGRAAAPALLAAPTPVSSTTPAPPAPAAEAAASAEAALRQIEEELLLAIRQAAAKPDPKKASEALLDVCLRLAVVDPAAAVALATEFNLDPLAGALFPNLLQQWAGRDLAAALAWAERQPPGALRDQVYARLAFVRGPIDPPDALRLVDLISSETDKDEAALSVLHPWAQKDLAQAMTWVRRLPTGPLRTRALAELESNAFAAR